MFSSKKYYLIVLIGALTCLTVFSLYWVTKLEINGEPKKIFKSEGPLYDAYLRLINDFPNSESNIALILNHSIFEEEVFNRVLELERSVEKLSSTQHVISKSMLPEVRNALEDPFEFEVLESLDQQSLDLIQKNLSEPANNFISNDNQAELIVIQLNQNVVSDRDKVMTFQEDLVNLIEQTFHNDIPEYHLTGLPIMQVAINQQISQDTLLINILSATLATIIALILFRSVFVLFVLSIGPAIGIIWTLAVMSMNGTELSVLTAVIPPLIFVLGYTNSAHILFQYLRQESGASEWENAWSATASVAKACFVSALTTGIGFGSLLLSNSPLIKEFGFYCGLGCMFSFLGVIIFTPVACFICRVKQRVNTEKVLNSAKKSLQTLGSQVIKHSRMIVIVSVVALPTLSIIASQSKSDYRFLENFSDSSSFYEAVRFADHNFNGSMAAKVQIRWELNSNVSLFELTKLEQQVEALMSSIFPKASPISLSQSVRYLPALSSIPFEELNLHVPISVTQELINIGAQTSVVTIQIPDVGSQNLLPKYEKLRGDLRQLESDYGNRYKLSLSGISPLAVYASDQNIKDMIKSLLFALVIIYIVMAIILRSWLLGLICMLPNTLPIVGVAAILVLLGKDLYFSNLLVFTICLGIAIDDTTHFVLRYRRYLKEGHSVQVAVAKTVNRIGLVLIFTSAIIGSGFFALIFSSIGVISLMGLLALSSLALALVADLIILPGLLNFLRNSSTNLLGKI